MSTSRLALCALLVLVIALPPAAAQERPMDVTCTACVVVDDTGRELFARAASQLLPNASTTKMTTALVVRRAAEPTESVVISARAAATGGGGLDLRPGEIYSVEALLFALLLDSSNDAAVALAEHVSGSHEAFVAEMNEIAGELGATDTSYVTAHGLDMPGHGSSARDLAAIADQLLADPLLARIVASPHARIEGRGGVLTVENRNLLLEGYPGATGVKTGFTAGAGNVLVASAERDGRRIIAVAMHSVDAATDAAALLDFGWQQLAETVVLPRGKEVGAIVFDHGSTPVIAARPVRDSVAPSDITYSFRPEGRLPLPVSPGDVLGRVIVTSAGGMVDSVDAVAAGAVAQEEDPWASGFFAGLLRAVGDLVTTP